MGMGVSLDYGDIVLDGRPNPPRRGVPRGTYGQWSHTWFLLVFTAISREPKINQRRCDAQQCKAAMRQMCGVALQDRILLQVRSCEPVLEFTVFHKF